MTFPNYGLAKGLLKSPEEKEFFQSILDNLPIAISIQSRDREIEYENQQMKEIIGSYIHDKCYHRWKYLPDEGLTSCKDCPANIALIDKNTHKVFRKTFDPTGKEFYIEIQIIPVLNDENEVVKFIELISNRTNEVKAQFLKVNEISPAKEINLKIALTRYGLTGSQIVHSEDIHFFHETADLRTELVRLSTFAFIGLFQNNTDQFGLFGPLPVLDYLDYSMLVFAFQISDESLMDERKKKKDNCLLILFFPRNHDEIIQNRKTMSEFMKNQLLSKNSITDLTEDWFTSFGDQIRQFIKYN